MTNSILITGAAGFIGFHAARYLHHQGATVVGLDNFNAYYPPALKRARAQELAQLGIEVIEGDINERSLLTALFKMHRFTHVLHLAAQAGVRYGEQNPEAYISSNLAGFIALLEMCRQYPQTRLVFASSSSVYGLNEKTPFAEQDPTDHPASLYAATKKAGEVIAFSYHHNYGIPMCGLRFFTVYGPWGRPDMAYFSFSQAIQRGSPLHLFNNGEMARDFTYIDDILPAISRALALASGFELFNLGNNRPEKLLTLVQLLEKGLGTEATLVMEGPRKGEVPMTFADISLAREKLGYAPQTTLDVGIGRFLDWYRPRYKL